jgi:hypothetical protein
VTGDLVLTIEEEELSKIREYSRRRRVWAEPIPRGPSNLRQERLADDFVEFLTFPA